MNLALFLWRSLSLRVYMLPLLNFISSVILLVFLA